MLREHHTTTTRGNEGFCSLILFIPTIVPHAGSALALAKLNKTYRSGATKTLVLRDISKQYFSWTTDVHRSRISRRTGHTLDIISLQYLYFICVFDTISQFYGPGYVNYRCVLLLCSQSIGCFSTSYRKSGSKTMGIIESWIRGEFLHWGIGRTCMVWRTTGWKGKRDKKRRQTRAGFRKIWRGRCLFPQLM